MRHPHRLELPERGARRIFLAERAGRIDRPGEFGGLAGPPSAIGRDSRPVGEEDADVADHALPQPGGQLDEVGEGDIAGRLEQADMAARHHRAGALVVSERVGKQDALALAELDMAARRDDAEVAIVGDLVGRKQDRLVLARRVGRSRGPGEQQERGRGRGERPAWP
jgi:hypothetical protein